MEYAILYNKILIEKITRNNRTKLVLIYCVVSIKKQKKTTMCYICRSIV